MKRFMIEDLPTAWSPRKTILYLRRGGMVPLERLRLLMFVIEFQIKIKPLENERVLVKK